MLPSCSTFAREAMLEHGEIAGAALALDRLVVRENAFAAAVYPTTCVAHRRLLADPVP